MKKSKVMDFRWNYNSSGIVQKKGFGTKLNRAFAESLLRYAKPYTPLKTGRLRDSATVTANMMSGKISYPGVSYADYQYILDTDNRTTPGTTSYWLDYAWLLHKSEITAEVELARELLSR